MTTTRGGVGSNQYAERGTSAQGQVIDPRAREQIAVALSQDGLEEAAFAFTEDAQTWRDAGMGWADYQAWTSAGSDIYEAETWNRFAFAAEEAGVDREVAESNGSLAKVFLVAIDLADHGVSYTASTTKDDLLAVAEEAAVERWDEFMGSEPRPGWTRLAATRFYAATPMVSLEVYAASVDMVGSLSAHAVTIEGDGWANITLVDGNDNAMQVVDDWVDENWDQECEGIERSDDPDEIRESYFEAAGSEYYELTQVQWR